MSSGEPNPRKRNQKREDYISWEDYFMAAAFLAAKRSKDPVTQVGACIVNDENIIVGLGYNGFPKGCSDDKFPWGKDSPSKLDNKHYYVSHAEMNAVLNRNSCHTKGCRLYVVLFPCNECAKIVIQSGIKEVIYMRSKDSNKVQAAKKMFNASGVKYRKFVPTQDKIIIDFNEIDCNTSQLPPTSKKPRDVEANCSSN